MNRLIKLFLVLATLWGSGEAMAQTGTSPVFSSQLSCRAIVGNNYGLCDNNDCRAIILRQQHRCSCDRQTRCDCTAMVLRLYSRCTSTYCRAYVLRNQGLCRSNSICRALITRSIGYCFGPR